MTGALHFMCGKAAAGKSTLARSLADDHGAVLVCADLWLQALYPDAIRDFGDCVRYARRLKAVLAPHVAALLAKNVSVVLDFPANVPTQRAWFRDLITTSGADHAMHVVDTDHARCIDQPRKRNRERPPGSMLLSIEGFEALGALFAPPAAAEGFNVERCA